MHSLGTLINSGHPKKAEKVSYTIVTHSVERQLSRTPLTRRNKPRCKLKTCEKGAFKSPTRDRLWQICEPMALMKMNLLEKRKEFEKHVVMFVQPNWEVLVLGHWMWTFNLRVQFSITEFIAVFECIEIWRNWADKLKRGYIVEMISIDLSLFNLIFN